MSVLRIGVCSVLILATSCTVINTVEQTPSAPIDPTKKSDASEYVWALPPNFPPPEVPSDNPMTLAKVELGRHLFYEKALSLDQSMSCGSCHEQSKAFTDGRPTAVGIKQNVHPRNSMSLANVAYNSVLTWANPHQKKLEEQMLLPLFGQEPVEMGMAGQEQLLLQRLQEKPLYRQLFAQAYPDADERFTLGNLTRAIAAFQRTLISASSPYDRYIYYGEDDALTLSAKRGETLFFSERLECFHCHGGFNFSDSVQHQNTPFVEFNFHNTGLYNLNATGAYPSSNTGLHALTGNPEDMGRFKAPTLRNIEVTAPYMHDGSIATLDEVLAHYMEGGRTLTKGSYKGKGSENPHKNGFVKGFKLTEQEKQDVINFLKSLTDHHFLKSPAFANPFLEHSKGK